MLALIPAALVAAAGRASDLLAMAPIRGEPDHPTPRPGIDASRVLRGEQVEIPAARPVFDLVRQIPQIVDGIRCHCGCAKLEGYYSLLTCYEVPGMAQHCAVCQGQARLAHRLHGEGWSLNGIRSAIDASFAEA